MSLVTSLYVPFERLPKFFSTHLTRRLGLYFLRTVVVVKLINA